MQDFWQGWLEDTEGRRAGYQSLFGNMPFNQRQFFTNLFPQIENQYLGALGKQVTGGGAPTLKWMDWLPQNFRPQQELLRAPTYQTGLGTQSFLSPTRFLYNF